MKCAFGVGRNQLFRRREHALVPHQGHRVVLAGVGAGDVVHPRGRNRRRHLPGVARNDAVDAEALIVAQQHRNLVVVFRGVQRNDAVAFGVVHIDDVEGEPVAQAGQHQAGAIHRVGKPQEQGQVVGAGAALVGGQHHKGLRRAHRVGLHRVVVELDFGHRRPGAANVAGRGVHQQILAGPVEAVFGGDGRRVQKGVPGELMHFGVVFAARVRGGDADVVPGVTNISIQQQPAGDGGGGIGLDRLHHPVGTAWCGRRWNPHRP